MRLFLAISTLCIAVLIVSATAPARNPWVELAAQGLGERSYAVRLKHLPVGQLQQLASRTLQGNYRFSSDLSFQLTQGQPVRVSEEKLFAGSPPHALLTAEQIDTTAATTSRITLQPDPAGGYAATIMRDRNREQRSLDWQHSLSDYLAVENWLPGATPEQSRTFSSIDFGRLQLRRDVWTLLAHTADGYEVSKSSALDATRLTLDNHFKPLRFSMAGMFEIEAVDPAELPIKPEPLFHSATYQVPVNETIDNPQAVRAITLRVIGNTQLVADWQNVDSSSGETFIRSSSPSGSSSRTGRNRTGSATDASRYLQAELSYPLNTPQVQRLAEEAVDVLATPLEQARQLTAFVHHYINYDHHSTMQNVLDVIRNRNGDCNEYAELFTTLSRALGLPARTIIGLAYTEERQPAFALHAWNDVLIDNHWHSFDPTWNETELDATHLRLPDDAGGMLQGITTLDELRFEVVSVRYDSDRGAPSAQQADGWNTSD